MCVLNGKDGAPGCVSDLQRVGALRVCGATVVQHDAGFACARCGATRPLVCLHCHGSTFHSVRPGIRVRDDLEGCWLGGGRVGRRRPTWYPTSRCWWAPKRCCTHPRPRSADNTPSAWSLPRFDQELLAREAGGRAGAVVARAAPACSTTRSVARTDPAARAQVLDAAPVTRSSSSRPTPRRRPWGSHRSEGGGERRPRGRRRRAWRWRPRVTVLRTIADGTGAWCARRRSRRCAMRSRRPRSMPHAVGGACGSTSTPAGSDVRSDARSHARFRRRRRVAWRACTPCVTSAIRC